MLREIRIYFEGDRLLRPGLASFFASLQKEAQARRVKFCVVPAGGKPDRDYGIALRDHQDALNILLRDSEGPLASGASASLCTKHGWDNASVFWMVEMMESWFHADKDALEQFYKPGFQRSALKQNPEVEKIPKNDLKDGLSDATRKTRKGDYFDHKTTHGPALLELIDVGLVRNAAPNCDRLFNYVLEKLSALR